MEIEEFRKILTENAKNFDIDLNKQQIEIFYKYMQMLIEWNEKINLTAIIEPKEIIIKHFIDSLIINKHVYGKKKVIDIGTGAGFPGVPLAIVNPNVEFTLLDSLNKRLVFLEEVIKENNLKNIELVHGRAEDVAHQKEFRERYDLSVSRAVAPLNVLTEYMLPFVKIKGKSICMKSNTIEEELESAKNAIKTLGGQLYCVENVEISGTDIIRKNIIINKANTSSLKFPRKSRNTVQTASVSGFHGKQFFTT